MIECVEDIKTRIDTVKSKTDNSMIDEVKMNAHLDEILVVKKIIDDAARDIDNLVEDLYVFFHENPSPDLYLELKPNMESLYATASRFYFHVKESKYYSGVTASVKELQLCLSAFDEIIHDLELFLVTMPNDPKFQELAEQLNEIFA